MKESQGHTVDARLLGLSHVVLFRLVKLISLLQAVHCFCDVVDPVQVLVHRFSFFVGRLSKDALLKVESFESQHISLADLVLELRFEVSVANAQTDLERVRQVHQCDCVVDEGLSLG